MKYSGYDAVLKVDGTTVAQVRDISGPGISTETTETTDRDGDGWKEFIGGLKDGGEVTFDILYDPSAATHDGTTGIVALANSREEKTWTVEWPGSVTWSLPGIVTKFEPKAPLADAMTADVTVKVSGKPTLA